MINIKDLISDGYITDQENPEIKNRVEKIISFLSSLMPGENMDPLRHPLKHIFQYTAALTATPYTKTSSPKKLTEDAVAILYAGGYWEILHESTKNLLQRVHDKILEQ